MNQDNIVIIGAGVLGLSSAIEISRQGHTVTVITRELPGDFGIDYASPWAGAHFRPVPSTKPEDRLEQELMQETYKELQDIAAKQPETSVRFIPGVEYFDTADPAYFDEKLVRENGYADWPGFRILGDKELQAQHGSIKLGVTYTSWVLNSPVYLKWLQGRAEQQGVKFIRAQVAAIQDSISIYREASLREGGDGHVDTVINASGRGFEDPDSFPSRGQFLIVSNPCEETISHHWADGSTTVIIPRPLGGGTVIGGTKEPNNWDESVSDKATATILERVAKLCPQMIKSNAFDVRQVYVARRPMRRGGMRLEKADMIIHGSEKTIPVIHCYGAGQSGYKISWGVAKRVGQLVSVGQ